MFIDSPLVGLPQFAVSIHVKIHLSKACLRSKESGKMSNLLLQYALQLKCVLEDEEITQESALLSAFSVQESVL